VAEAQTVTAEEEAAVAQVLVATELALEQVAVAQAPKLH
jgi:hypothetical protein